MVNLYSLTNWRIYNQQRQRQKPKKQYYKKWHRNKCVASDSPFLIWLLFALQTLITLQCFTIFIYFTRIGQCSFKARCTPGHSLCHPALPIIIFIHLSVQHCDGPGCPGHQVANPVCHALPTVRCLSSRANFRIGTKQSKETKEKGKKRFHSNIIKCISLVLPLSLQWILHQSVVRPLVH